MSIPGSLQQRAILQPQQTSGYTTFCGVNAGGSRIVVGWDTGSARGDEMYARPGSSYEITKKLSLTASLASELNAVALSGAGTLLACGDKYNIAPTGKVFVYTVAADGSTITQAATITPPGDPDQYFGAACYFNQAGTRLYIGAPGYNNDAGAVYLYDLVGTTWTPGGIITIPGAKAIGDSIGVSFDEAILAVGSLETNYYEGRVYVMAKDGSGVFQLRDTLDPPAGFGGQFGAGLCLSPNGNRLYVGSPTYGYTQQRQGIIVTLDYVNGTWTKVTSQLRTVPWAWQNLGLNLALSHDGQTLVAGLQADAMVFGAYQYRVSGVTKDDNDQPAMRQVMLHDATTGALADTGWSAADGTFTLASFSNSPHYAICRDSAGGVAFNALVLDGVVPQ